MHFTRSPRAILHAAIAIAGLALYSSDKALAQADVAASYPAKPIRVIVGFAAGGGNDLLARIVSQKLAENIGQPVVVENKPGAGGRLAVEYAQGQPGDGYTMIVGATGQLAISSAIYPNLPFHPTRTLIPLTMIASYPLIIAGAMNETIKSVADLVAWGKANPARSNYPTSSPAFTIPTELFKLKTGMPAQPIPYKSTNEMMLSIVGGQTLFGIADPSSTVPLARSGKLRALAVNGTVRSTELPDVPTMAEIGLADVDIRLQWSGAFVIAGTPSAIAGKLEAELRRVLADASVRDKIKAISYDAGGGPGVDFARQIDADIKAYSDVVKAANLKFE
ncbi:MAG: tripartite tricarboxylate transporter substrate binding protein [Xanthobacteraceae bacterium]|jgi:tripartite-type tricarboxylate transporter receptor subunit TctC